MKQFILTAILLLFVAALFAQTTPKPLITVIGQSNYELDAAQPADVISIPLRLDQVNFKDVKLVDKPVYIRLNNLFRKSYADAVKLAFSDSANPRLHVTVDLTLLRAAGTYEMMVAFDANNQPRQEVTVSLIRPAAKLELLDTVRVVQVGNDIQQGPLGIRETGKQSGIASLQLNAPLFPAFNKDTLISFPSTTRTVKKGELYQAAYTLHKDRLDKLPLGRTIGKMEISEPELSSTFVVPFEIIRKRSRSLIILIVFLGVALGAFLRIYVKNRKEWEETKLKGYDLLTRINSDLGRIRDDSFRTEVKVWTDELFAALEEKWLFPSAEDKNNLTKKIEETTTKYNERRKKFDESITESKNEFQELSQAFEYTRFNAGIEKGLEEARRRYEAVRNDLVNMDASSAQRHLQSLKDELSYFLKTYTEQITDLTRWIDDGSFYPNKTPETVKAEIKSNNELAKADVAKIETAGTSVTSFVRSIIQANQLQENIAATLGFLQGIIQRMFGEAYQDDGTGAMNNLKDAFERWKAWLDQLINDPLQQTSPEPVDALNKAWNALPATTEKGFAPPDTPATVAALKWRDRLLWPERMRFININTNTDPVAVSFETARTNWLFYSILRTFLIFLLMCLAAYNFYGPIFVGTTAEMITMFLFAFSLDITLENVAVLRDKKS